MVLKKILLIIVGLGIGGIILMLLSFLPVSVDSPVFSLLGISKPRIIGFLPYWLTAKATHDYNPSITTLTYFGLTISEDGHIAKLTNPQQEDPAWYDLQTKAVKDKLQDAKNHNIVLSLAVVAQDEDVINKIVASPQSSAKNLLSDILPLIQQYGFSDINIDIESFQKADSSKQHAFVVFLSTIKNGLPTNHRTTLTVDMPPITLIKQYLTNPIQVGNIADYVILMAYDFHTVISSNVGPVAPLYGIGQQNEYDVATAVSLAKKEISVSKLILGIPLYGYEWDTLSSQDNAATIPNSGATASNRRVNTITTTCPNCGIFQNTLAKEPRFVFKDKPTDVFFHQAYVFDSQALANRVGYAEDNYMAGLALWALGYEGDSLLMPLSSYKSSFSL